MKEDDLRGKKHDHRYTASQCEEGCGCNFIHLGCSDEDCTFYDMAEGWPGCNIDWETYLMADTNEERKPNLNPGSKESVARGCTCAVLDNGRGSEELGRIRGFYVTEGCPLHDKSGQPTDKKGEDPKRAEGEE